jgi:hypothetical protein
VVVPPAPGAAIPLGYYAQRLLHPLPRFITPDAVRTLPGHPRLWVVSESQRPPRDLGASAVGLLAPYGYRPLAARSFTTSTTFNVVLAAGR